MSFITDNFKLVSTDTKSISKLKQLVLDLAIRGELMLQCKSDEAVDLFLEAIKNEKHRLIQGGKLRKQKKSKPITEEEIPYQLPDGWAWRRFGDITFNRDSERIPLSREERKNRQGEYDYYGASGVIDHIDDFLFSEKLLLIGEDGANLINRSTPIAFIAEGKYWVNNHAHVIDGISNQFLDYLCLYINAIDLKPYLTGTAQPKMNQAKMNSIFVAVPPKEEQHRIVQKVNTLFQQIDQLAEQSGRAEATREQLRVALLHHLEQASDRATTATAWQPLAGQFDLAIRTREDVQALRQTILQLAVRGALVPQDPNDEPAGVLLERIKMEKERLVKAGEIRKAKALPVVTEEERPFEVPRGWVWCRLGELTSLITKGSSPKWQGVQYVNEKSGILFITSKNVGNYSLKLDALQYVEEKFNEIEPRSILSKGDILMNIVGASIGRTAVFDLEEIANINQAVCLIRLFPFVNSNFLLHFFNSPVCLEYMFDKQVDNARANLSMGNIAKFLIALPPILEQRRIVQKVEALLQWCDALEAGLERLEQVEGKLVGAAMRV